MPSPIGHCLMGCSLYADRPADKERNWWALAALVFFANAPDLDFIPGALAGHPMLLHRMATHCLLGPLVMALVAALAFSWRGRAAALGAARLVFFGVLSHIVLDYFCAPSPGDGPMLFWPLSTGRFASSPALFPPLSTHHILSWGNVVAVIGEAAIVSVFLLVAVVRRSMTTLKPAAQRAPSYPLIEAGE
jgi:membrane-bound metal-dependent hydrolase YbcI (DUF457 family)